MVSVPQPVPDTTSSTVTATFPQESVTITRLVFGGGTDSTQSNVPPSDAGQVNANEHSGNSEQRSHMEIFAPEFRQKNRKIVSISEG